MSKFNTIMNTFVIISVITLLNSVKAQVNKEIDNIEDLLAIESNFIENEVSPLVAIQPAPPGFPGERFTAPISQPSRLNPVSNRPIDDKSYSFSYETPDGTKRYEQGGPQGKSGFVQRGGWEYVGPDGRVYSIKFVADEKGFQPVGDHLPTPPPLPPALQRYHDAWSGKLSRRRRRRRNRVKPTFYG